VFERFTEGARQAIVLAQDEAHTLRHNFVGTEHILLGLLREEESLAARILEEIGVYVEDVRAQVARIVGQGDEVITGQIPFTPRAKKVLELSLREALALDHNYIGTEHLLLALLQANQREGVALQVLEDIVGGPAEEIREAVLAAVGGGPITGDTTKWIERQRVETRGVVEPRLHADSFRRSSPRLRGTPLVPALVVAAVGFPLGLLVGFLIWG
jgi:ATP-dependent Clp protease ATP-binding subunit ClpA